MGLQIQKKRVARLKRHERVRKKVDGTSERPRLTVFRSNLYIYAQIIDDTKGVTLAMASSLEKGMAKKSASGKNIEAAKKVGLLLAKRAKEQNVTQVVFDKGGYLYHGKIKALADAVREGGLVF